MATVFYQTTFKGFEYDCQSSVHRLQKVFSAKVSSGW